MSKGCTPVISQTWLAIFLAIVLIALMLIIALRLLSGSADENDLLNLTVNLTR